MNRRQILASSAAGLGTLALGGPPLTQWAFGSAPPVTPVSKTRQRLEMPPLLDTTSTGKMALVAQTGTTNFFGRAATATSGYNQSYLGPIIRMKNGPLAMRLGNKLTEQVTYHWHGLLVPGSHDGGPHTAIDAGKVWDTEMQIAQRPATVWYHSHVHGRTAPQVYSGLAGVIHVTDGRDDQRGLPSQYGIDDLTLIIQDRRFDDAGRMVYEPTVTDVLNGFSGPQVVVNGQINKVAVVPRGIVRLRYLNASNARIYTFNFEDGRPMLLFGSDGGYLPKPVEVQFLRIAPGERFEVLVDFGNAAPATLISSRGGIAMRIMDFETDGTLTPRITRLPTATDLGAEPVEIAGTPVATRRFGLNVGGASGDFAVGVAIGGGLVGSGPVSHDHGSALTGVVGDFGINGKPHDMKRIDNQVKLGTVERWIIGGGGQIEHPFHVHGVHFKVVTEAGGSNPRPENRGWKDIVLVSGETEILVRFDHLAPRETPYMYHCHILEHEDAGMMGQFTVT